MKNPQERKNQSEQIIQAKGIAVNSNLPVRESCSEVRLRPMEDICKRAVAALLSTQIAIELNEQASENIAFFTNLMDSFGVRNVLNAKESRLLDGGFSQQDVIDVVWEYECYWSLVWALGLVEDISDAGDICNCEKAIHLVADCSNLSDFMAQCRLRDTEEILDMLDLYYRFHWAVVEKKHIDPSLPMGNLNGEVVFERRRGLEWLISAQDADDWHDISLHT